MYLVSVASRTSTSHLRPRLSSPRLDSGCGFVTFHPQFAKNGKFYTLHTEAGPALQTKAADLPPQPNTVLHCVVTEWTAAPQLRDTVHTVARGAPWLSPPAAVTATPEHDGKPNRPCFPACGRTWSPTTTSSIRHQETPRRSRIRLVGHGYRPRQRRCRRAGARQRRPAEQILVTDTASRPFGRWQR